MRKRIILNWKLYTPGIIQCYARNEQGSAIEGAITFFCSDGLFSEWQKELGQYFMFRDAISGADLYLVNYNIAQVEKLLQFLLLASVSQRNGLCDIVCPPSSRRALRLVAHWAEEQGVEVPIAVRRLDFK
jgi:hypothetical protein